ncbi:hypothetical protein CEXT_502651 [Caerostris extrusa]|uniref:Uncharacterized protein n=1 Tax=Caerostris extrusa TaxID=172846 RepID=A0AAV4UGK1_CAEEX|nr:hypothetical protein CEXT_502651 [Caerostris extrusa]
MSHWGWFQGADLKVLITTAKGPHVRTEAGASNESAPHKAHNGSRSWKSAAFNGSHRLVCTNLTSYFNGRKIFRNSSKSLSGGVRLELNGLLLQSIKGS